MTKAKFLIVGMNEKMILPRVVSTADTESEALRKLVDASVISMGSEYGVYELKKFKKKG